MPKPLVYLETTIFSFYHDDRESHEVKSMRAWTRDWWDNYRAGFDLITSVAVLAELARGSLPHREAAQTMAATLPALPFTAEASRIVAAYITRKVCPPIRSAMPCISRWLHSGAAITFSHGIASTSRTPASSTTFKA